MRLPRHWLLSLSLSAFFSFTIPIIASAAILLALWILSCIPLCQAIAETNIQRVLAFLATFGTGDPVAGSLTIGCAWGFVGGLFDLCTPYRYQLSK
ncbi:MAG: hypothetical protein J7647_19125 [Cyanobacteria bacterium SBLK]|nr:hypothetical protein [Cyanobacteria bacterium SBLK]